MTSTCDITLTVQTLGEGAGSQESARQERSILIGQPHGYENLVLSIREMLLVSQCGIILHIHVRGLKNGWTCALKCKPSSRHSILKMGDDEVKIYTSFYRLFATSCPPKAFNFSFTEHNKDWCLGLNYNDRHRNAILNFKKRSTELF